MSEPKLISPMLDGFIMGECVSDHHGVRCCPALRENTDERFIVKIISVPASQVQLDALLLTGACKDAQEAQSYFMELTAGVAGEADILARLSKLEGFVPYLDSQIVTMDEGVGYELYLLSPYRRSLETQMRSQPLTHLAAVNLGLDLCAAMAICRRAGYLYVDIKPGNIFVSGDQEYRIGDLGFLPLSSLPYASLPEKYRSSYTAPEIRDAMSTLNDTMDIYALGLVLYQVYNNGELPFEGEAPEVKLPPPAYADYEMAEIILKACSPNVWERWQDPTQMGQALVNYMQRNGVNDTPIVPPPVVIPPEEPEDSEEEFLTEDENEEAMAAMLEQLPEEDPMDLPALDGTRPAEAEQEEPHELSFMEELSADETAPTEESVQDLEDTEVTQEVSDMLAQADELIAHELPEPAVAPDPIDVPIPPPLTPEEPEEEIPQEIPEEEPAEVPEEEVAESIPDEETEEEYESESEEEEEVFDDEDEECYDPDEKPRRKGLWIGLAVTALLMVCLWLGSQWYYHNHYLQAVESLQVIGTENNITVFLTTDIDESLLSVTCTDTYGNTRRSSVASGKAYFSGLEPGTQYKVQVEISGSHKLTGSTMGSYTTAAQTQVLNFNASIGPEDGSVVLNFSVNGPDSAHWSVAYAPVGSTEKVLDFSGHNVTVTGLIPGTEYSFRLIPADDLYLAESPEIRFTPTKIVYAQNLTILSCGGGSLSARWELPQDAEAQTWTVRCFNDAGYDETFTTTDTSIIIEGLDHAYGYTIKVTAQGMTQSATAAITANPITITGFEDKMADLYHMDLTWNFTGSAPSAGWLLTYTVNDGEAQTLECAENSARIPVYPGDKVKFSVQCMDPVTYYPMDHEAKAPKYERFEGFGLSYKDLKFSMCRTPDKEDWDRHDLEDSDYKTTFAIGEAASFLIKRPKNSDSSEDTVTVTWLIRDEKGVIVSIDEVTSTWDDLWNKRYCELDMPRMPAAAGNYTVDICFNGQLAESQTFIIE